MCIRACTVREAYMYTCSIFFFCKCSQIYHRTYNISQTNVTWHLTYKPAPRLPTSNTYSLRPSSARTRSSTFFASECDCSSQPKNPANTINVRKPSTSLWNIKVSYCVLYVCRFSRTISSTETTDTLLLCDCVLTFMSPSYVVLAFSSGLACSNPW